jgi:hypothetical protein
LVADLAGGRAVGLILHARLWLAHRSIDNETFSAAG